MSAALTGGRGAWGRRARVAHSSVRLSAGHTSRTRATREPKVSGRRHVARRSQTLGALARTHERFRSACCVIELQVGRALVALCCCCCCCARGSVRAAPVGRQPSGSCRAKCQWSLRVVCQCAGLVSSTVSSTVSSSVSRAHTQLAHFGPVCSRRKWGPKWNH